MKKIRPLKFTVFMSILGALLIGGAVTGFVLSGFAASSFFGVVLVAALGGFCLFSIFRYSPLFVLHDDGTLEAFRVNNGHTFRREDSFYSSVKCREITGASVDGRRLTLSLSYAAEPLVLHVGLFTKKQIAVLLDGVEKIKAEISSGKEHA